ncbi:hypothetical protein DACRYDRAFT_15483 [Dacryopinax primogenitus]|uniref:Cyclin N-terminal domain-containing protein n=1 Tax=Dacryopinax primogenitus (strain DJM 731) TaxID=1858805 RepID=M5GAC8_DACPD|nr:uncharacterized protein DACRYDRAFT_15483 [Dacryopinax primogenitus]EJU02902.1 hypothetical protein DACRYDRAFT_15483 [Dacryopinax primogenitus]
MPPLPRNHEQIEELTASLERLQESWDQVTDALMEKEKELKKASAELDETLLFCQELQNSLRDVEFAKVLAQQEVERLLNKKSSLCAGQKQLEERVKKSEARELSGSRTMRRLTAKSQREASQYEEAIRLLTRDARRLQAEINERDTRSAADLEDAVAKFNTERMILMGENNELREVLKRVQEDNEELRRALIESTVCAPSINPLPVLLSTANKGENLSTVGVMQALDAGDRAQTELNNDSKAAELSAGLGKMSQREPRQQPTGSELTAIPPLMFTRSRTHQQLSRPKHTWTTRRRRFKEHVFYTQRSSLSTQGGALAPEQTSEDLGPLIRLRRPMSCPDRDDTPITDSRDDEHQAVCLSIPELVSVAASNLANAETGDSRKSISLENQTVSNNGPAVFSVIAQQKRSSTTNSDLVPARGSTGPRKGREIPEWEGQRHAWKTAREGRPIGEVRAAKSAYERKRQLFRRRRRVAKEHAVLTLLDTMGIQGMSSDKESESGCLRAKKRPEYSEACDRLRFYLDERVVKYLWFKERGGRNGGDLAILTTSGYPQDVVRRLRSVSDSSRGSEREFATLCLGLEPILYQALRSQPLSLPIRPSCSRTRAFPPGTEEVSRENHEHSLGSAGEDVWTFMRKIISKTKPMRAMTALALYYVYKLKHEPIADSSPQDTAMLALIALMLANKCWDDNTYTNRAWSECSGMSLEDINRAEREFLNGIGYNISVNRPTYDAWVKTLISLSLARSREDTASAIHPDGG